MHGTITDPLTGEQTSPLMLVLQLALFVAIIVNRVLAMRSEERVKKALDKHNEAAVGKIEENTALTKVAAEKSSEAAEGVNGNYIKCLKLLEYEQKERARMMAQADEAFDTMEVIVESLNLKPVVAERIKEKMEARRRKSEEDAANKLEQL